MFFINKFILLIRGNSESEPCFGGGGGVGGEGGGGGAHLDPDSDPFGIDTAPCGCVIGYGGAKIVPSVFSANQVPKAHRITPKITPRSSFFLEAGETRKSCSRLHAGPISEVLSTPKADTFLVSKTCTILHLFSR